MSEHPISSTKAINGFLDAVRDAAAESPAFRARLIEALCMTVVYEGEEQFEGADPAAQAARWSEDAFKRIWNGAKPAEIRAVLRDKDLATPTDSKGFKKPQLLDLLYERALAQAEELGLV